MIKNLHQTEKPALFINPLKEKILTREYFLPEVAPRQKIATRIAKRLFDFSFSLFATVFILSWLIPILAILIKLESRGAVFFKQKRTGLLGEEFICLKFRTMFVNRESDRLQAKEGDARITKLGKFLRLTNMDEFPQVINVLLGEMSLVGPRPHMVLHSEEFSAQIAHYDYRHEVKPGITGLAQIKGFKGPTTTKRALYKRVQWDFYYVQHHTLWMDIYIVLVTIKQFFHSIFIYLF